MKRVLDPDEPVSPRGQQQETANVHIEHYFLKGYDPDAEPWKSIKSHHYASLAAIKKECADVMDKHEQQLSTALAPAERQRTEELQEWLDNAQQTNLDLSDLHSELNRQLLSALAAIETAVLRAKTSAAGGERMLPEWVIGALYHIDLSLLHEHDAKVREPLVELLQEVRPTIQNAADDPSASPWQREIRLKFIAKIDALAKIKK